MLGMLSPASKKQIVNEIHQAGKLNIYLNVLKHLNNLIQVDCLIQAFDKAKYLLYDKLNSKFF